ncbi:cobyrinic acid a,c-diamide synthase [Herbaspirillum hiltneri N3]|uniref:Cobyrinic acid a,c-diamide synthase n=1 Tax=Herbaspirillum hiltneri N3 TaxID=1262470 RepID=A0ABM5V2I2_9BURK|nr:cobyrinate a,c-diamide synthase [Herbaspirillum hiltneri]AKZ63593.1 cobyrinic acid a,c-diamide synthase [Herbaspirillum hiltneri N3]
MPISSPAEVSSGSSAALCPALFITAPGSNHGKTTVTAALARWHRSQGSRVRVFKTGPDFLDPTILERASGNPVYQLDLWMMGVAECRRLLHDAAQQADLILVEGVMGLFDGEPCSADLAELMKIPAVAVVDVAGVAQTLGAIGYGLAHYRPGFPLQGLFANGVASLRHEEMLRQGMPHGINYLGGMPRNLQFKLPERHLGLVPAAEVSDLDRRIDAAAVLIGATELARMPTPVEFAAPEAEVPAPPQLLAGQCIAVARDKAFSFIYPGNLDLLRKLGASLVFFSPLHDAVLPPADSVYLPGGYPELHLQELQGNVAMKQALIEHCAAGKPLYAECGGLLYLLESLSDKDGARAQMLGVLSGRAVMQRRLQGLGYQSIALPQGTLRCHTFHYSTTVSALVPAYIGERLYDTSAGERVYRMRGVTATYLHAYFASSPEAAAALFLPQLETEATA